MAALVFLVGGFFCARPATAQPFTPCVARYGAEAYAVYPATDRPREPVVDQLARSVGAVEDYGGFVMAELDGEARSSLERVGARVVGLNRNRLDLHGWSLDTRGGITGVPAEWQAEWERPGLYVVQLYGPVRPEWLQAIRELPGAELVESTHFQSFGLLVWLDNEALAELPALPFVNLACPFHPWYRSPAVVRDGTRQPAVLALDEQEKWRVEILPRAKGDRIVERLEQEGLVVEARHGPLHWSAGGGAFVVRGPANAAARATREPEVLWVEPVVPVQPALAVAREVHQRLSADGCSGDPWEVPVWTSGVTGAGSAASCSATLGSEQLVGILDSAFDSPDLDCDAGVPSCTILKYADYRPGENPSCSMAALLSSCTPGTSHGTGTAGIVAGSGAQDGGESPVWACTRKGQAFGARLWAVKCEEFPGDFACLNSCHGGATEQTLSDFFQVTYADGSRLSNHSWGSLGDYNAGAAIVDAWAYDNDNDPANGLTQSYLWFFAAGNEGPGAGTIGNPAEAKNDVTGAAVYNGPNGICYGSDPLPCDEMYLVPYSSRGPTGDGRHGPDLAGASQFIQTPDNGSGYQAFNGTSAATPSLTGLGALLRDWLQQRYGLVEPGAALQKALLLNSGHFLEGRSNEMLPGVGGGWGRASLALLCDDWSTAGCAGQRSLWQEGVFTGSGESSTFEVSVANSSFPLFCTLAWLDPPNLAGGGAAVNNLELRVTPPGGGPSYCGNDFFDQHWSNFGCTHPDGTNVDEGVRFQFPSTGIWRVEVQAANIATGPQPWAVACSGRVEDDPSHNFTLSCNPASLTAMQGGAATTSCTVTSANGFNGIVRLGCSGLPAGAACAFYPDQFLLPAGETRVSELFVSAGAGTTPGLHTVLAQASTGSVTHASPLSLAVAVPDPAHFVRALGGSGDEAGGGIVQNPDGGYLVVGGTSSFGASADWYVNQLDVSGNVAWGRTFSSAAPIAARAVERTADGGWILASSTSGEHNRLLKLDGAGNLQWSRSYVGSGFLFIHALRQTFFGKYLVAGSVAAFSGGAGSEVVVFQIDGSGAVEWVRAVGGGGTEIAADVQALLDGGSIIGGYSNSYGLHHDLFVLRLDGGGVVSWARTYGLYEDGSGFRDRIEGAGIAHGSDDTYCVTGSWRRDDGPAELLVVKLGYDGELLWSRALGGAGADWGVAAAGTSDGGCLVAGNTESFGAGGRDGWLLRLDGNGNLLWNRTVGGAAEETVTGMRSTDDGGAALVGTTRSFGAGGADLLLAKFDAAGDSECDQTAPSPTVVNLALVAIDVTTGGETPITGWNQPTTATTVHTIETLPCTEPPDFAVRFLPAELAVIQGYSGQGAFSVQSFRGFSAGVHIGFPISPSGIVWDYTTEVTPPPNGVAEGQLTVWVDVDAEPRIVPVEVTATSGLTHFVPLSLVVVDNLPPTAGNDYYITSRDQPLVVGAPGVLANDSDPEGESLAVASSTQPQHGSVSLGTNGAFTYTPEPGYYGSDGFSYTARDAVDQASSSASASITVRFVAYPQVDLTVNITDPGAPLLPGGPFACTVTARNLGPDSVSEARVQVAFSSLLRDLVWSCVGNAGGICPSASGAGDIDAAVALPALGEVVYTANATVDPGATGVVISTATVAVPAQVEDPDGGNNSSTDEDPICLDDALPANPTVLAALAPHVEGGWSQQTSIAMQWAGATEFGCSGLTGYAVLFDEGATTDPGTAIGVVHGADPHATTSGTLTEGLHYFHLRTCDLAGNCATATHRGAYGIDLTPPSGVGALGSSSHQVDVPSIDNTIDVTWTAATDNLSGVDGYAHAFTDSSTPVCDQVQDLSDTAVSSPPLGVGAWFVHVCARDLAGNWGAVATAGPYIVDAQLFRDGFEGGSCGAWSDLIPPH